jgi:hypothetical protein
MNVIINVLTTKYCVYLVFRFIYLYASLASLYSTTH